ncbi:MAG: flagellar protein FlaG [Epsilonproteobacteria bacterium]|nr:flagellar protein FlaG [Campylobacterota bacterium]
MDIFSAINTNTQKNDYSINQMNKTHSAQQAQNLQQKVQEQDEKKSKEELKKELQQITEELNKVMNPLNQDLKFNFDDKADELVVKVVDIKSDKVIRQFPPEEALQLMEKMRELVGLLFDKKG